MAQLPFAPTNLTNVLLDVLFLLLIFGISAGWRYLKAHQTLLLRSALAKKAVLWVERFASSTDGPQKFAQAAALLEGWLKKRGINGVLIADIHADIQEAVAYLKASGVLAASGPTLTPAPAPAPVTPAK